MLIVFNVNKFVYIKTRKLFIGCKQWDGFGNNKFDGKMCQYQCYQAQQSSS